MPIVIAHVVHWPKSGIGTLVRQLTRRDPAGRFRYIVILLEADDASIEQYSESWISVVGLSISAKPLSSVRILRRLLRQADIVHTHSFLPQLAAYLAFVGSRRHIRTVHNPYPYFRTTDFRSWMKRRLEGLLIARLNADLVSVSGDVQRSLPWSKLPGTRSTVIENGLDLEQIRTAGHQEPGIPRPDGILLVSIGRLEDQKGFDVLLDAMSLLRALRCDADSAVHLWVVGDGGRRAALEAQASMLGLASVKFLGHQTQPYRYLAQGDVFVLPSRFEGFGLAAIEALALNLPVVLTDFGGISGRLTHGENAHIVPKEDPKQLAEALHAPCSSREYRERLAANGRAFAEAHYTIESCAARYEDLYSRARGVG
jgi:glycosyltransferase involved in cell wall biosynthesis